MSALVDGYKTAAPVPAPVALTENGSIAVTT